MPSPSSTSSSEILPAVAAVEEFCASARLLAEELASDHTIDHLGHTGLQLGSRGHHTGVLGGASERPQGGTVRAERAQLCSGARRT